MNSKDLQREMKALGFYKGEIDGVIGPVSRASIKALLAAKNIQNWGLWDNIRQANAAKQIICQILGINVGDIDGLVGPQTQYAFEVYDDKIVTPGTPAETWRDTDITTSDPIATVSTWPRQKDVPKFFGPVGQSQGFVTSPYPLVIAWDKKKSITRISAHNKVKAATERVPNAVHFHYGHEKIKELRLDLFGGSLNVRKMRGGSAWSMHSWGIAFDFDPERNQLKWGKDRAEFAKPAYNFWFEAWEKEGAISLGRERNYDWMHTQFARL